MGQRGGLGQHRQAGGLGFRVGMGIVQIGLAQHAKRAGDHVQQQLAPDLVTHPGRHVHGDAAGAQNLRQRLGAGRDRAIRLPQHQPGTTFDMDMTGLGDRAGGIDDAGNRALGANGVPDGIAGVHTRQPGALQLAAIAMEIEPGHAVHREHDRRIRPQQRTDAGRDRRQGRGLHRDDHHILRSQLRRVRAGPHLRMDLAIRGVHMQPIALHRRQMRAARHHRHLRPALEQAARQMPADRPGAVDAHLHDRISMAARARACTPRPMQASSG